jgi:D-psicose/D-tagatose/L-ribulose 3-epimerase
MNPGTGDDHDMTLELGLISSAWHDSPVGVEDGIRLAKRIGFDTYDVFEDPLVIDDATRHLIRDTCEEVGLPIRSAVCIAIGLVDFNPPVRRFTVDRCKAYLDQQAFFGGRNVLLVIGEYYWELQVLPAERIWGIAVENVREVAEHAAELGLEVVIELEPFKHSLVGNVHELARFVREVDHPAVKANADISHLHLSGATLDDVAVLEGMVGHVHLSDCNGEVHGDLPPGRGVTPIKDYLGAVVATGFTGTVSVELEYSPEPDAAVDWVTEAYRETARIMSELGVRALHEAEPAP